MPLPSNEIKQRDTALACNDCDEDHDEAWSSERLQTLLDNQVPEDLHLDYKRSDALPVRSVPKDMWEAKRKDIGKHATAFANSDGGVLIYGIEETAVGGRNIPGRFDPVDLTEFSKDQLTQIISSNSEPTLVGVRVMSVRCPGQSDESKVCLVIVIPKGDTAHMALDGCYYFRNEATTTKMRDWQVRDTMNRAKVPKFIITGRKHLKVWNNNYPRIELSLRLQNVSQVIARQFRIKVTLPSAIRGHLAKTEAWTTGEGSRRGASVGLATEVPLLLTHDQVGPFYPEHVLEIQCRVDLRNADAIEIIRLNEGMDESIFVEVFADNMPPHREQIGLNALPLTTTALW